MKLSSTPLRGGPRRGGACSTCPAKTRAGASSRCQLEATHQSSWRRSCLPQGGALLPTPAHQPSACHQGPPEPSAAGSQSCSETEGPGSPGAGSKGAFCSTACAASGSAGSRCFCPITQAGPARAGCSVCLRRCAAADRKGQQNWQCVVHPPVAGHARKEASHRVSDYSHDTSHMHPLYLKWAAMLGALNTSGIPHLASHAVPEFILHASVL